MNKIKIVISLGGSIIVPDKVDYRFLRRFSRLIKRYKKDKIVIITGGGSIARDYINALRRENLGKEVYSWIGIGATRLNARLVSSYFKQSKIPLEMKGLKGLLRKNNIVVCGALGFKKDTTSDGNAAEIAKEIKADVLINMTNVKGLYSSDPRKNRNAKFIPEISFNDFYKRANKIKFKPGQHFVLDQKAAKYIKDNKIKTVIIGNDLRNLRRFLRGKKFVGTVIS